MKIALTLTPSYADRQPLPHLGLAALSAYLVQKNIQADMLDLNIECRGYAYEPLALTSDKLYVDEMLDLPLLATLVQWHRRGNLRKQLMDKEKYKPLFLEYALDFGFSPPDFFSRIHYFNLLALTCGRRLMEYDLVCFTLYRSNLYFTALIILLLREQKPHIKIAIGGPQVTQSELCCRFLLQFGIADAVIRGAGEESLAELILVLERGTGFRHIPGIMTYDQLKTFTYIAQKETGDLDYLPTPDFSRFKLSKYTPFTLPLYTSRGCPYSCSYCAQQPMSRMRYRSPEKVIEDIKNLKQQRRVAFFRFADSLMNSHPARLEELAERLIKEKSEILWQAYFRADITPALARKLRQSGLEFVTIGVESFSDPVLERMHKRCSKAENLQAIATFLTAGISVKANLIVAHPGESGEAYLETLQHAERLIDKYSSNSKASLNKPGLSVSVYPFHVSPGSPVYHRPADFGVSLSYADFAITHKLDDDLAEFIYKVPTTFSVAGVAAAEAFKRFQALNELAQNTNPLLTSAAVKKLIRDALRADDRLFMLNKLPGRVVVGEPATPMSIYLEIEKTVMELPAFVQTILKLLNSAREIPVGDLHRQVTRLHVEVKLDNILDMLAILIHNRIIQLACD